MKAKDSGPAFPSEQHETQDGDWNQTYSPGMSLRDYFAAKAMSGLLRGATWEDVWDGSDECAATAYFLADAMLKARES